MINYIRSFLLGQDFQEVFYYNLANMTNNRIHELRKIAGISQKLLADRIGVSQKAIDFWEKGTNEPKSSYVIELANYFKVTTDYILGREEEDGRIIVQETGLPSDENALLTSYRTLPPELKTMAQEYFKSLDELKLKINNKN